MTSCPGEIDNPTNLDPLKEREGSKPLPGFRVQLTRIHFGYIYSSENIFKSWKHRRQYVHKPLFIIGSAQLLNLQKKKFWLPDEKRYITLNVSTRGMRTIDKKGIRKVVNELRAQGKKI